MFDTYRKIFIVGATGSMATYLMEAITKNTGENLHVMMLGRNLDKLRASANILNIATQIAGNNHYFEAFQCDLDEEGQLSELLNTYAPEVVVNCTRAVSGIKYGPISQKLNVGYGVWVPFSLHYSYIVANELFNSGEESYLINSSYSDAVCPALHYMNDARTPICGIGNVFHLVPRIRLALFNEINRNHDHIKLEDIEVYLTAGHFSNTYISRMGDACGSETILDVIHKETGEDLLEKYGISKEKVFMDCMIPVAEGKARNLMAASSTYRTLMEVLNPSGELFHVPGPEGLVGGYPVRARTLTTGEVILHPESPFHLMKEMLDVNAQNLACDGIEAITKDGIVFTHDVVKKMSDYLGWYPKVLPLTKSAIIETSNELRELLIIQGDIAG